MNPQALYNQGLSYLKQGEPAAATQCWQQILAIDPRHPLVHYQLGNLAYQQENYQGALPHYQVVLTNEHDDPSLYFNYASCLLQLNEHQAAEKAYLQALALAPDDLDTRYNLGVIKLGEQDLAQAEDYFRRVLAQQADHFASLINLGICLIKNGRHPEATPYYERALALQPGNPTIQYTLNALRGIELPERAPSDYIESLFDQYAGQYDQHLVTHLGYNLPETLEKILKPLKLTKGQTLDLGCGTGLSGQPLHPYSLHLTGVDLSRKMLLKAAATKAYHDLIKADISEFLPRYHNHFDLINAAEVLIYFGKLEQFFYDCRQALKPGGHLIFTIEVGDHTEYQLNTTGRYAHSLAYIEQLSIKNHFRIVQNHAITPRQQAGDAVHSQLFVIRR